VERIYLAQNREELVTDCYEYGEQPLGSIKCWVSLGRRESSIFSGTTVPWS